MTHFMPLFRCEIINPEGKLTLAMKSAGTAEELVRDVQKNGSILCRMTPTDRMSGGKGLSEERLFLMTRKLHAYLKAHLPLGQSLTLLCQDLSGQEAFVLQTIRQQVMEGSQLHKALALFPEVFSPLYVNTVKIGEESGALPSFLSGMIDHMTAMKNIRSEVVSAMTYPLVLVAVAALTVVFLATTTMPIFEAAISDLGGSLPWITTAVMAVVGFGRKYFLALFIVCLLGYLWLLPLLRQNRGVATLFDRYLFAIPVVGPIYAAYHRAVFSRTMLLMLSRGINLMESLAIAIDSTGNGYLRESMERGFRQMREGGGLRLLFAETPVFRGLFNELALAGEETGALSEMFSLIHEYEAEEMSLGIKRLLGLLEPMLILITGLLVGTILIAMFLPIFQLGEGVR